MLPSTVPSMFAVVRCEIRNAAQLARFAAPRPLTYIRREAAEWRRAAGWALAFCPMSPQSSFVRRLISRGEY